MEMLRANTQSRTFQRGAWEYRQATYDDYAGPRLTALIRASKGNIPRALWHVYQDSHENMLPFYEAETDAIRRHNPDGTRAANIGRAELMAKIMVNELAQRRVLSELVSS